MQATILFLSVALAGQCAGGGCPAPTRSLFARPAFARPAYAAWAVSPVPPAYEPARVAPAISYVRAAPVVTVGTPIVAPDTTPAPAPAPRHGWHWVLDDGLRVRVWSAPTDHGTFSWDRSLAENVAAVEAARASAAAPKPEAPKPEASPGKGDAREPAGETLRPSPGAPAAQGRTKLANGRTAFNYGIDPTRRAAIGDGGYHARGENARKLVEEAGGGRPGPAPLRLTVIGSREQRQPVIADLDSHAALAGFKDRYQLQEYDPGSWAVDPSLGFDTRGTPTVLLQAPDGKVLYRQSDYRAGPDGLAQAIRRADPTYDPKKDPGSPSSGWPGIRDLGGTQMLAAAGIALILLLPGRPGRAE